MIYIIHLQSTYNDSECKREYTADSCNHEQVHTCYKIANAVQ